MDDLRGAIAPESDVVAALRAAQASQERRTRVAVERSMDVLGAAAREAYIAEGGFLVEVSLKQRGRIRRILDRIGIGRWMERDFKPTIAAQWGAIGKEALDIMRSFGIAVPDQERIIGRVLMRGGRRAGLIDFTQSARKNMFRLISDAKLEGWGPDRVAREIERYVPAGRFIHAGPRYRAELIARTEMLHANRVASLEVYRANPEVRAVKAFDGDYDPICAARNGKIFSFEDAEVEIASTHPNCVLAFGPVT